MGKAVPSIVILTLGIALQGTEEYSKEVTMRGVYGLTRVKSAPFFRGVETTVELANDVGVAENECRPCVHDCGSILVGRLTIGIDRI